MLWIGFWMLAVMYTVSKFLVQYTDFEMEYPTTVDKLALTALAFIFAAEVLRYLSKIANKRGP